VVPDSLPGLSSCLSFEVLLSDLILRLASWLACRSSCRYHTWDILGLHRSEMIRGLIGRHSPTTHIASSAASFFIRPSTAFFSTSANLSSARFKQFFSFSSCFSHYYLFLFFLFRIFSSLASINKLFGLSRQLNLPIYQ
jgi:hypothetical protein